MNINKLTGLVAACAVVFLAAARTGAADAQQCEPARGVLGMEGDRSISTRLAALKQLSPPIAPHETDLLVALINDRSRYTNLQPTDEALFVNELLNALRKLNVDNNNNNRLSGEVVALYRNTTRAPVLRDYAIQHLASLYSGCSQERKKEAVEIFFSAVEERKETLAGTALRALFRVSRDDAGVDRAALGEAAERIAGDDRYDLTARIAAVQVCGLLDRTQALPAVRGLAASETTQRIVRIAALNALGRLGTADDVALLEATAERGGFYAPAAEKGRKLLLDRLKKPSPVSGKKERIFEKRR